MERFVCIHGHFYQPPRENPWLEEVEVQDSAYPYHDWNERVVAECYAPNSASRLLDGDGRITDIISNYSRVSFNFGPTLLSWMEVHSPEIYRSVLEADRQSAEWRSGHGNALAQPYNHMIMPLADSRDRRTQVLWGIRDFEHRFGRFPEGMWLPETAVDLETLDLLAECGLQFSILAPHQAARVRKIGAGRWKDLSDARIDPSQAYLCILPSGRRINLFFYDGPISRAVAFEGLLNRGEDLAGRLLSGFSEAREWPQIVNIATDGETYGHHHRFGDMALAYALHHIESAGLASLTNYGEYLEKYPPQVEVQIVENTSWSCVHGIERWRGDCGCNTALYPNGSQRWRAPLREALDRLRDSLSPLFEEKTGKLLRDPWKARDEYIEVLLDRTPEKIDAFFGSWAKKRLSAAEKTAVLKEMELQRHAMLMYTSCGWFFDELSGTETVQILQYAARAIQLARELYETDLDGDLLECLAQARSNIAAYENGAHIYDVFVRPAMIDLAKVAVHYAVSSLDKDYNEIEKIYCYSVKREDYQRMQAGDKRLAIGKVITASDITLEIGTASFCVLHLGGHVFNGGLRAYGDDETYRSMKQEMTVAFEKGEIVEIIRLMDKYFGMNNYSLVHLFKDEQRRILGLVTAEAEKELEHTFRIAYEKNQTLVAFLLQAGIPAPKAFLSAAEFSLNIELERALMEERIDEARIEAVLSEMRKWNLSPDSVGLEFMLRRRLESTMAALTVTPSDASLLDALTALLGLLKMLPFEVNLWQVQNGYFSMAKTVYREILSKAQANDDAARAWIDAFRNMGEMLSFSLYSMLPGG